MTSSTTSAHVRSAPQDMPAVARRVLTLLQRLQHGTLHVQWPDGSVAQYGAAPATGHALNATLHLHSYAPLTQALKSGDIGFAESYIAGEWTTNNLSEFRLPEVTRSAPMGQTLVSTIPPPLRVCLKWAGSERAQ